MNLKDIKLVISDMDGTLLNSKHEVSQEFFNLFKKGEIKGKSYLIKYCNFKNSCVLFAL